MAFLNVAFDAGFPHAPWGPLFHVFRLERRDVLFKWRPVGFPTRGRSRLEDADVGLFVHPLNEPGLSALTLDTSPMVVVMAAGHPLADCVELTVGEILDQTFPGANHDPEWGSFWTLDEYRGGPAKHTDDSVQRADESWQVVAAGRAIATAPSWVAQGIPHPGVIALPLGDGPDVTTRLVWRTDDDDAAVRAFVDLAGAWTRPGDGNADQPIR